MILDSEYILLYAISAIETGQYDLSLSLLDKIVASNDSYYLDHAYWYKSLVLLQENRKEEAVALLKSLSSRSDADHHQESIELLKDLNVK